MKQVTTHAMAAKAIRSELKAAFPGTKFSVGSRCFSMGDAVDVRWEDGPSDGQVRAVCGKYQYGHFDCMDDGYRHDNSIEGLPQVKFVQTRRSISEGIYVREFEARRGNFVGWDKLVDMDESSVEMLDRWNAWTARDYIARELRHKDLTGWEATGA